MEDNCNITIAVVSDLHCHEESAKPQESWLIAGARRQPAGSHPMQALISEIRKRTIIADVVLCPGDLANRISSVGMMQSWDHLRELQRELHADVLLTTLGNHDVDCHKKLNPDPFDVPRNLHEAFPTPNKTDVTSFWTDGFIFALGPNDTEFLVLNTVIAHNDEITAKRGTFDFERIKKLEAALEEKEAAVNKPTHLKRRIAMMHHHPLLHSSMGYGSADVLEYGDAILRLLNKFEYRFIIHGHRHDPRITRVPYASTDSFVFAAGSFSAILKELSTWTRNLFHLVKLQWNDDGKLIGEILSWEYYRGVGWRPSTSTSAALPHVVHFCSPRPSISLKEIEKKCDETPGAFLRTDEVAASVPDIGLLLPSELEELCVKLEKVGVKLTMTAEGLVDSLGRPHKLST